MDLVLYNSMHAQITLSAFKYLVSSFLHVGWSGHNFSEDMGSEMFISVCCV